jgi:hypothetical protein
MRLYQILLPIHDNIGRPTLTQRELWLQRAFDTAKGFSDMGLCTGQWCDNDGKVYIDTMAIYHIGCEGHIWSDLRARARELFPDQKAICWVDLGEIHFDERLNNEEF